MASESKGEIVMVHGMWGGPWYWENYINFFASKGYACIAPTLLYHGGDPNNPPNPKLGNTSITEFAKDIENQIANLKRPRILIGHSMGGLIVQILASRGLADAVIALAPVAPAGISLITSKTVFSRYSLKAIPYLLFKKPHRLTFEEALYLMLNLLPPDQQKEEFKKLHWDSGRARQEIALSFFDRKATGVDESKINCPVLIVAGKEDNLMPPPLVRKVAKKYRKVATYWELENHAHWIMGEPGWERVLEDIYQWLQLKIGGNQK